MGADVTRGLAVLGMFTAHLGASGPDLTSPHGYQNLADGRSAATFALLAGLSAALLSGGTRPSTGPRLRYARVRVLVRAALLWPIGALMIALGTPVAVILPGYAVMFALVTVAMSWRVRTLLVVAGVVALVGPVVVQLARPVVSGPDGGTPQLLDVLVGEYYPAAVWMAYLLVGLALGRTDLLAPRAPLRLGLLGVAAAVIGYGGGLLGTAVLARAPDRTLRTALTSIEPHADSTSEVVGNVGVTLVVLALALLAVRHVPVLVAPLAATGALALTAYCGHLVAIAAIGDDAVWDPSNARLAAFVVVTLAATTAWRLTLGRGPLELVLHTPSSALADMLVPEGRRRGDLAPAPRSDAREHVAVKDREPPPGGAPPAAPGLGEGLERDVVGEAVLDGLPREVRGRDALGPQA